MPYTLVSGMPMVPGGPVHAMQRLHMVPGGRVQLVRIATPRVLLQGPTDTISAHTGDFIVFGCTLRALTDIMHHGANVKVGTG